jgi:hypothetical protein
VLRGGKGGGEGEGGGYIKTERRGGGDKTLKGWIKRWMGGENKDLEE